MKEGRWSSGLFSLDVFRNLRVELKPRIHKDIIALAVILITLLILFVIF